LENTLGIGITGISIILQFVGTFFALRIAVVSRRPALLPLALAFLLMGVRRSYSLFNCLMYELRIDTGAESIALLISLLVLVGLYGVGVAVAGPKNAARKAVPQEHHLNLAKTSIMIGVFVVVSSAAVEYFSYSSSRTLLLKTIYHNNLMFARSVANQAELLAKRGSKNDLVDRAEQVWADTTKRYGHSYLCIVDSDGTLLLHTLSPEAKGQTVADLPLGAKRFAGPENIGELAGLGEEWVGNLSNRGGQPQVVAFTPASTFDCLIAVHVPIADIDSEIRTDMLPWTAAVSFISFVLLPLSLGLMYWSYSGALAERLQTEEALRDSDARALAILDSTMDAIVNTDEHGYIETFNAAAERIFAYSADEVMGRNVSMLMPSPYREEHDGYLRKYLEAGECTVVGGRREVVARRKDGTTLPIDLSVSEFSLERQRKFAGVVRDITEHKRAEEELRQYEHIVSTSTDMLALLDENFVYLAANAAYFKAFELSHDELIGHTAIELFGEQVFEKVIKPAAQRCLSGEQVRFQQWLEFPAYEPRYMIVNYYPYRDDTGEIKGFVVNARDITGRKQSEDALRSLVETSSRQFGESFFESMALELARVLRADYSMIGKLESDDAIQTIATVADGKLTPNFRYELRGTPCEHVVGRSVCSYASDIAALFPEDAMLGEMKVEGYVGVRLMSASGDVLGIMSAMYRAPLENGEFAESILQIFSARVSSEIERGRAEEEIHKSQEQLLEQQRRETELAEAKLDTLRRKLVHQTRLATIGQMTASIAHEIRNPLGAVRNAAYLLKRKFPTLTPKLNQYFNIIDQEVSAVDHVIRDMLEMARGKEPKKEPFDLSQTVREIFKGMDVEETARFELRCDPEPFMIVADQGQIRQVILNLVTNAVQATSRQGEVLVELSTAGECILIEVQDNGVGVDAEHRVQLFDPLFTTKAKGTGLGLTICRQIVERHGGVINFQPKEGSGARFCVKLPQRTSQKRDGSGGGM